MGEAEGLRRPEQRQQQRIDLSQLRPQIVQQPQTPQVQSPAQDEARKAQIAQRVVSGVAKTFDNVLATNQEWRSSYLRMALV